MKVKATQPWQLVATVVVLLVAACGASTPSSSGATRTIVIGVEGAFTGQYNYYGERQKGGILYALSKRGTLSGTNSAQIDGGTWTVKLVYADDGGTAQGGPIAAQQLIDAKANIMIGSTSSSASAAALPLLIQAKIPVVSPFSIRDDLVTIGKGWFFRASSPNSCGAMVMAQIAKGLGANRVDTVDDNEGAGTDLSSKFASLVKANGAAVVGQYHGKLGQTDWSSIANNLIADKPDLVTYVSNYVEAGRLVQQSRQRGLTALFLGGDGVADPKIATVADPAKLTNFGAIGLLPPIVAGNLGQWPAFQTDYAKFAASVGVSQTQADEYVAYSYDSLNLAIDAAKRATGAGGDGLRAAIGSGNFTGITGNFKFDNSGERVGCDVTYFRFQDGKWVTQPIP